jgi:carbon monoxide dehydrogenase subunit G
MKMTHEFKVARPPDVVWDFFQDVPAVAACMPGAELISVAEDGTCIGKVSVKLGPLSAVFEGEALINPDSSTRTCVIDGTGVDRKGGSRGQVKVGYSIAPTEGGTQVEIDADVTLSGAAAQFGRTGLINEMSSRLIGEFANCLEAKLEAGTAEEAAAIKAGEVRGISLFFSSLAAWFKNLFRRKK